METSATRRRGWEWGALRVLHPFPAILVTAVTVAIVPFADTDAEFAVYLVLGLGMLCYQFAIGVANDLVDADLDAAVKPWKPIPRGALSRRAAVVVAAALAGAGVLVTSGLDLVPWLVGVGGLACGLAYDVHLKRTPWSWLPWAIAFPLIPVWVYAAADAWEPRLWWAFPLGGLLALSLYFANQAPGADDERSLGVGGLAQSAGERRSRALALGLFGVAGSGAVAVLLFEGTGPAMLAAIAAGVAALLAPRATAYFGRDGMFGVLAVGAVGLAFAFLSAA
ncbi:MAG: UbiA family prenyltransferase [Dehalococcoidia bacterium]